MFILRRVRAAGFALAALLYCGSVGAQVAAELKPPVAQGSTDVPYPAGGDGDAVVVLELLVEKDGSVSSAKVVEGVEPFAEQARSAALGWRFTAAERDATPVAARIRARVAFHRDEEPATATAPPDSVTAPGGTAAAAPGAAPNPAASSGVSASAADGSPPPAPPLEVTVVGARHEIGQTTLSKSDVREMPGAFGDAFRAIEALPGVTSLASGLPYFFVRGAPPNNAGYFIDGVRVPLLFHLGLAQSVLHPGLIDHVDFFPSAAPARYGGFAGGMLAGQTREPATAFHGEANLRLVDAGALLEAPFADGRGSALVAGRYGYPGPIVQLATKDLKIGYWDYQARVSWRLGQRDTISLFTFGSHDYLAQRSPSQDPEASKEMIEQFVSDSHRVDVRYDHALDDGRIRLALTGGYDSQGAQPTYLKDRSLAARLEVEQKVAETLRFRGGASVNLDDYALRLTREGPGEPVVPQSANPPPVDLRAGLHADFVWHVTPRVELVPGARFDLFGSSRKKEAPETGHARSLVPAIDPRLSARVKLTRGVASLSTLGLSHQYPSLRLGDVPAPMLSVPGFPFGVERLQTAAQASQGVELALPGELGLTATGFYSRFWGLTDLSASCFQYSDMPPTAMGMFVPPYVCPNNSPVRGHAYGLELLLRRPFTKKLGGWLSYTLSRSVRQAHFLTPEGDDDVATVPSEFDRTHVLNAVLSYDLGRRWRVGARLLFQTGTPYSQRSGALAIPPYNGYRNAAFYRLDLRVEKRWRLGKDGSIAVIFEGQNVTLQKELSGLGLDCKGVGDTETCKQTTIGPLTIPSVGVEAFF